MADAPSQSPNHIPLWKGFRRQKHSKHIVVVYFNSLCSLFPQFPSLLSPTWHFPAHNSLPECGGLCAGCPDVVIEPVSILPLQSLFHCFGVTQVRTPCPPPSILLVAKVFPISAKRRECAPTYFWITIPHGLLREHKRALPPHFLGAFLKRDFLFPISCGRLAEGPRSREIVFICVCKALGCGELHPCSIPRASHRVNQIIFMRMKQGLFHFRI